MQIETIKFFEEDENVSLTSYIRDNNDELCTPPRPALVICPGGGYEFLSERESEPVAMAFLAEGFNCFILRYSVKEKAANFAPLIQASLSIKHIRENHIKYNINPKRIFIVGFSAGGHLAASAGILWNHTNVIKALGDAEYGINRPDGMILSYPVISAFDHPHFGSIYAVCGSDHPSEELRKQFSLEYHIKKGTTCPAFIWHTFEDSLVPVQNSLCLVNALAAEQVPFEFHVFPRGPHGLSLASMETAYHYKEAFIPEAQEWVKLAVRWTENLK